MLQYDELKKLHRELRDSHQEAFRIRIHRALSWLKKSELENDYDAKFIFLWISLNCAYSMDKHAYKNFGDETLRSHYFQTLLKYGNDDIYEIIWKRFSTEIRGILNNEFILNLFWVEIQTNSDHWKKKLSKEKIQVQIALQDKSDTSYILTILFKRLYVLRNQLFHGGATWQGKLNRQQVNNGTELLRILVPLFIKIMMLNPAENWGSISYPPISDNN